MTLSGGGRLGPYDIVAPLGAGGMGEVYLATDTKLKRQVAVKILPEALAADPDRLARFQREAEVLASLNHPRIATIYGLEVADGTKALVMELVEGPTLADRIAQGSVSVDEVLPIARQIAEALEAAHEQGIIHRDLKPANIKVREDGTVKVLDFGLAKLAESGGTARASQRDPSHSPTLTNPAAVTGIGTILGTAAYMSPEQARGRPVDKRTDIWAFGAVLFEMLTGARAFPGEDVTETLASVVKSTPNWAALPTDIPPPVVTLIQRCLEKDRNARIGDIAVARFLLADHATLGASSVPTPVSSAAAPRWRQAMPWVLAAVVAGTLTGWLLPRREGTAPPPVAHLQMSVLPADQLVGSIASVRPARTAMALSPDGRTVVFAATRGAATHLYVRALDRTEATAIPGTEGATPSIPGTGGASGPFFSPDGAWIGFWAGKTIKKVPVAGGPPTVISDVAARGGSAASWGWGEDASIFYESDGQGIWKVSSAGGAPASVTTPDTAKGERHLLPHALPGGNALLFTALPSADWQTANIVLHSLGTGEQRILIPGGADARYVSTGHLVYMKTGTLMAVPFDVRSQQVTGAPVALIDGVMQGVNAPSSVDETGAGQFVVSTSGTLLYALGGIAPLREGSLVWVERTGAAQPVAAVPAGPYLSPRLSPDGQKVALAVRRGGTRNSGLWVYDMLRGAPIRPTLDGGGFPVWSPDGRRLVYSSKNLYAVNADGSGQPERLASADASQFPSSWASAANAIVFTQETQSGAHGIWVLPMEGDRQPRLFLESRFDLWHPELSPDGHWMAYVSNESGTPEVYVQSYPGPGERLRISTAWGMDPIWTANGRELLYRSFTLEGQQFFSVAIRSLSPFRADPPRLLFAAGNGEYDSTTPDRSWDVSADGQRFLLSRIVESTDKPVTTMHVVLNWAEELKRLVPSH